MEILILNYTFSTVSDMQIILSIATSPARVIFIIIQSKTPVFNRVKLVLEPFQARTFEIGRLFEIKQRQKKGNVFSAQKYLLPPPLAYGTIPEETIGRKTDYSINRSSSYSSTGPVELGGQGRETIAPLPPPF